MEEKRWELESDDDEIYDPDKESFSESDSDSSSTPSDDNNEESKSAAGKSSYATPGSSIGTLKGDDDEFNYESDEVSEDELLPAVSVENIIHGSRLRTRK